MMYHDLCISVEKPKKKRWFQILDRWGYYRVFVCCLVEGQTTTSIDFSVPPFLDITPYECIQCFGNLRWSVSQTLRTASIKPGLHEGFSDVFCIILTAHGSQASVRAILVHCKTPSLPQRPLASIPSNGLGPSTRYHRVIWTINLW